MAAAVVVGDDDVVVVVVDDDDAGDVGDADCTDYVLYSGYYVSGL